ncbi:MAG: 4-(cytidine 5'-diphospho)-2-C-methyl-D-erythritol kinase [Clostridioides sp.]|nr:4-(cytidine 5'-diphospho)-2-C-methyl-D-erythritol kinase [Clostridioides sp.]
MKLKSRAKINLSLDIIGKREDGYSLVEMIMQSIDLYDMIDIKEIVKDKIIIKSNSDNLPLDRNNIAYKAASLIKNNFEIKNGVEIFIDKNIPIAAGLAGGSSNAAAVLVGLNKIWSLGLNEKELQKLGAQLGADVPFCISGRASLAENIGEKLTDIKGLPQNTNIVVCKPDVNISTKMVYSKFDISNVEKRPDTKKIVEMLNAGDFAYVAKNMQNVLESVTTKEVEDINKIKLIMNENAIGSLMSGSGPTVFGIFKNKKEANLCSEKLKTSYAQTYVVTTSDIGVEIC